VRKSLYDELRQSINVYLCLTIGLCIYNPDILAV